MNLGDARTGKLPANMAAFARALRRAGVPVDVSRVGLALDALQRVGVDQRDDASAALESVFVSREQDRLVFRELFDAFFRNPDLANKLLSQLLPSAEAKAEPSKRRPRVREALAPQRSTAPLKPKDKDQEVEFDAAMTASDLQRLRHADFNALSASEYQLVERLVRDIRLPIPEVPARRLRMHHSGVRVHWPRVIHEAAQTGGELLHLPRMQRRPLPLPLLVLVDVSGSMERYARLLLAYLHAATLHRSKRDVFAFGTHLTDLGAAFRLADTDDMLLHASQLIDDFAGGTQLGTSLAQLRAGHNRLLVGRRTLVLLITDGLDTGEPAALEQELAWLKRRCRRLLWLNPLLRFDGYAPVARGAAALHRQAHGMLAVHNIQKLQELASSLARLLHT